MTEKRTKATKQSADALKAQDKRSLHEPTPEHHRGRAEDSDYCRPLLGNSAMEPHLDSHAALLGEARFSGSVNASQKGRLAGGLQRGYGNAYVQGLLASRTVQSKITVEVPEGQHKTKADRVADTVVRPPDSRVQNQAYGQAEEEADRLADNTITIGNQLGPGHPLDGQVKSRMQSLFGQDLSHVRVHTDAKAAQLSNRLDARAFAVGRDIAFGDGQYDPTSLAGNAIIAHELAHVVQQSKAGRTATLDQQMSEDTGYLERDANMSAISVVASLLVGAKKGFQNAALVAKPRLRSGLKLQRCTPKAPGMACQNMCEAIETRDKKAAAGDRNAERMAELEKEECLENCQGEGVDRTARPTFTGGWLYLIRQIIRFITGE